MGTETGDDALVWRRGAGPALVATTDFFAPIVDDPRLWGRIAAANAASDIYAMGGAPLFGMNLVAWPRDEVPLDVLAEVLAGGGDAAREGGWVVAGGHTVDGPEPMYGQAVIGEVEPNAILTNAGGHAGDALVLTKALGTGLVATAVKRGDPSDVALAGPLGLVYRSAVESMVRLNADAASVAQASDATAATDVTGFGLLGHLHKLALGSGLGAVIEAKLVPVLPGVSDLIDQGYVPGGTLRNLEFVRPWLDSSVSEQSLTLLGDPQTSGGLLFSCPARKAQSAVDRLRHSGHEAGVIGELEPATPGAMRVVSSS